MARKKKPSDSSGRRKPNYKLPSDDHLVVKPIKRTKSEMQEARWAGLLSHEWSVFTKKQRKDALLVACSFGADWADVAYEDGRKDACGDEKDYRRVVVRWAFEDMKACNDVEVSIMRTLDCTSDPRFTAFQIGFDKRREEMSLTG